MARDRPVTMKRALRLMDIIEQLQEHPRSVEELAERYGVSPRTVYRDLLDIQGEPKYAPLVRRVTWGFMDK